MNIIVLCGGLSNERDVSLSSGALVTKALRSLGHKAVAVDLFFGYPLPYSDPLEVFERDTAEGLRSVQEEAPDLEAVKAMRKQDDNSRIGANIIEICRAADIVFMALHGEDGENGKLQALFDIEGIRYTGSGYLGSAVAMQKNLAKTVMAASGIHVPEGMELHRSEAFPPFPGYPCVVKPTSGGSSVGVSIVRTAAEYEAALTLAFRYEDSVLIERYIPGRELTVGVYDGSAMPVIEIIPKTGFYDYRNKYQAGLTEELCPAPLTEEETRNAQRIAETAYRALRLQVYGRVDMLLDAEGTMWVLEANTLPGMTPTSLIPQMAQEMGIGYAQFCQLLVETSMKKYEA